MKQYKRHVWLHHAGGRETGHFVGRGHGIIDNDAFSQTPGSIYRFPVIRFLDDNLRRKTLAKEKREGRCNASIASPPMA